MEISINYKKKYSVSNVNLFIFIILSVINLTPYLSRITPINVDIMLVILWILTAFLSDCAFFLQFNKVRLATYIWLFYQIIMQLIGFADNNTGNLFNYLVFWFSIIVYDFYSSHLNKRQVQLLVRLILVTMVINLFSNIYELSKKPELSKMITGSVLSSELGVNSNVGTYLYVLIMNIIMMAFIVLFLKTESKILKFVYFFISLSSFYMALLASSMIGILSGIIMLTVFLYIITTKNSNKRKFAFILSVIIITLIIILFSNEVYSYISNVIYNMDNILLKERSLNVIDAVFRTRENISFSGREGLYKDSIITFFDNFIIGIGRRHINVEGLISLHSQILDDAAYFGIIGIIIQISILYYFYKTHLFSYVNKDTDLKAFILSVMIGSLFFALFNPINNIISGLMLFIFMALFCKFIVFKEEYRSV